MRRSNRTHHPAPAAARLGGLLLLLAASVAGPPALAQTPKKPVASTTHAAKPKAGTQSAPIESPYARAASQHRNDPSARARAEQAQPGHGQTTVQSVGRPHKAHSPQQPH